MEIKMHGRMELMGYQGDLKKLGCGMVRKGGEE
jgi:hypothetical protein